MTIFVIIRGNNLEDFSDQQIQFLSVKQSINRACSFKPCYCCFDSRKHARILACYIGLFLPVLRTLRGRPTLRFFTASKSFGSISHSRPYLNAFRRFASMSARTLLGVTPSL